MVGLLSAPAAPPALRVSACDAIGAAAASDSVACDELRRLGAVPLLAKLVTGGTKSVAEQAQSVLSLLQQRGDEAMESEVASAMAEASSEGAPNLVAQLQQGNKLARRAALLLDCLALDSPAARAQIVKLGAVPRLVKMVRRGARDTVRSPRTAILRSRSRSCYHRSSASAPSLHPLPESHLLWLPVAVDRRALSTLSVPSRCSHKARSPYKTRREKPAYSPPSSLSSSRSTR